MTVRLSLSVIIPTCNRRESLRLTLAGLDQQTYPPDRFEVLVASDGATDGTDEMVEQHACSASYHLRLVRQSNAGPARARNRGFAEAAGEVVVFLDDDVEPVPGFLAAHARHHADNRRVAVIGPMSPDPRRRWAEPPWIAWEHALLDKQYTNWVTGVWTEVGPQNFYTGNVSVRRLHLQAVGGFDERFKRQEDIELAYRMERELGLRFTFEPAAKGIHRPTRSLAAWLQVPYAYGSLDVLRIRQGNLGWEAVRGHYETRRAATRAMGSLLLACPQLAAPLQRLLLASARAFYAFRLRTPAFAALSVVHNLRYLEGAQAELGIAHSLLAHLQSSRTTGRATS